MNLIGQKYKIWVNTAWVVFIQQAPDPEIYTKENSFILAKTTDPLEIMTLINQIQSKGIKGPLFVLVQNVRNTWEKVLRLFKLVQAAGGCILNPQGDLLFFYRRGYWDLPKGKIEKNESPRQAALREVFEEVGLNCTIKSSLPLTFHTYIEKERLILKKTHWFLMSTNDQKVALQTDEDIERHRWLKPRQIAQIRKKLYPNLVALLEDSKLL
jgi:8-oxo-dGTP pyrophosphatase MutT (NUDIX family)